MTDVKTFALDLAERAGWTFTQTAAATFAAAQVGDYAEAKSALIAACVAGGGAVLSLIKGVIGGLRTGTASTSQKVAGTGAPVVTIADV